jgi:hypothetical protein
MDAPHRSPKNRPALEQAIGQLRHCEDALLRHLARQIERDELSPATAFEMLERFELASLSQLAGAPGEERGASDAAGGEHQFALLRRIEILGATLRGMAAPTRTVTPPERPISPRRSSSSAHPRSSRAAG